MTRLTLVLKFMGLTAFLGLVFGAVLGAVGGLIGGIYTALLLCALGAVTGVLQGGLNGIVLGVIAVVFFHSRGTETQYKVIALVAALVLTLLSSFFWFFSVVNQYSATGSVELWTILIPTTITMIASGYASQRVAKWYLSQRNQVLDSHQ